MKLRITGKGHCNLTNQCELQEFLANVPTNPRFLYAALNRFSPADTMAYVESLGVPLKVERGKRVFPQSDQAADIVSALWSDVRRAGVRIVFERVEAVLTAPDESGTERVSGVRTARGEEAFDAVILCSGGVSYPQTGSDGDGHRMARALGHTVTPMIPSLVPLTSDSPLCPALQGLALRNVGLKIRPTGGGKPVYEDFGELLFTHFGLSGPTVLSASAHLADPKPGRYEAVLDLKPALSEKQLDERLLSDFAKYSNKDFIHALDDLLPRKMIEPFCGCSGIEPHRKVHSITREERLGLVALFKGFRIPITGFRPIREAIVTKGGVSVREVSPKTMESKLLPGLYFAGELLDLDAYTGGFNLQIAFATGVLAGESAAMDAGDSEGANVEPS
jgi:predicted Rossmann fold flavoprotein